PFLPDFQRVDQWTTLDGDGVLIPARHPQLHRKGHRERDPVAKRIRRVLGDRNLHAAAHHTVDLARPIRHRREPLVLGRHPQTGHKLRPALMEVGSAAAEIRLEAEQIRVRFAMGPVALVERAQNLVGLWSYWWAHMSGEKVPGRE